MEPRPNIIVVDGIDGAGKTSALRRIAEICAEQSGGSIVDVPRLGVSLGHLPTPEDIGETGTILVEEPTSQTESGRIIRERLLRDRQPTSVHEQARLFAEDREALYRRVVIPHLERQPESWVVQSRGLMSSLAYQAERLEGIRSLEEGIERVLGLPGNAIELAHAPRLCLIFSLMAEEAARRLAVRGGTVDLFEADRILQARVGALYLHPAVHAPFLARSTRIRVIDANRTPEAILRDVDAVVRSDLLL